MKKNTLISLFIIFFSLSTTAEYRLGVDYRLVDNPLPVKRDGIVEVSETFWYGCNACYQFDPVINSWASRQESDVRLTKMPVTWGGIHQLHASLYYTIEALKLDPSTHAAVFVTIHKEGNFLQNPKAIEDFLKKFGVAPEVSKQYMNSFTVKQMVNRGIKHSRQLKVSSVPMMIVDGKYIIESKGSYENILKVVDYVVELQRPNS
ncbi:thiol:disulfide interchange protein DsbA/DsbL [Gammaproteobacteria bacterium]|jgi:thiol:disulfide interchange protein DsbA|nr:thiol:disulfide interchange protein DsbA/DsbL [Gammaproteobacteria bacterium]|tara:strand:- start:228 stop:842 length:615 start_codon:yes stop_codon:yes gene_type:complete